MNLKSFIIFLIPIVSISVSIMIYITVYKSDDKKETSPNLLFQEFTQNDTLQNEEHTLNNEEVKEDILLEDQALTNHVKNETIADFATQFLESLKTGTEESLQYFEESHYINYTYQDQQQDSLIEEYKSKISHITSAYYNSSYTEGFVNYMIVSINDRKQIIKIVSRKDIHHDTTYYLIDEDVVQFLNMIAP